MSCDSGLAEGAQERVGLRAEAIGKGRAQPQAGIASAAAATTFTRHVPLVLDQLAPAPARKSPHGGSGAMLHFHNTWRRRDTTSASRMVADSSFAALQRAGHVCF
jgi:hypothetical protein